MLYCLTMARPRKSSINEFTASEMAAAGAISLRNFQLIFDRGLVHAPKKVMAGKGVARTWDSIGLEQMAIVRALNKAGLGLVPSAKLVSSIMGELLAQYRYVLSGVGEYRTGEFKARYPNFPWAPTQEHPGDVAEDFWLHHYLRTLTDGYPVGPAQNRDVFLEIVDQQYVLHRARNCRFPDQYPAGLSAEPLCRITNWGRGEDVSILPLWNEVREVPGEPGFDAKWVALCEEYRRAVDDPASHLTINLTRAIRDGFDNVRRQRFKVAIDG